MNPIPSPEPTKAETVKLTTEERWPKPPPWKAGVGPWWCGRCGGCHGWDCPYDPAIFRQTTTMQEDRKAGRGPFMYGPYPGGSVRDALLASQGDAK